MIHVEPDWPLHVYSRKELSHILGRMPTDEEWETANCSQMGRSGHLLCGLCPYHGGFRRDCGCAWPFGDRGHVGPALRIRESREDPHSLVIEVERIDGIPRSLPEIEQLMESHRYSPMTPAFLNRIEMDLRHVFTTLWNEGRLFRAGSDYHLRYFPRKD